jgi:hypothetical protein
MTGFFLVWSCCSIALPLLLLLYSYYILFYYFPFGMVNTCLATNKIFLYPSLINTVPYRYNVLCCLTIVVLDLWNIGLCLLTPYIKQILPSTWGPLWMLHTHACTRQLSGQPICAYLSLITNKKQPFCNQDILDTLIWLRQARYVQQHLNLLNHLSVIPLWTSTSNNSQKTEGYTSKNLLTDLVGQIKAMFCECPICNTVFCFPGRSFNYR